MWRPCVHVCVTPLRESCGDMSAMLLPPFWKAELTRPTES